MFDRIAAEIVLFTHMGFVIFVVFGGLLVMRYPKFVFVHVPAFIWGVWIEVTGGICPLTPVENAFRHRAGEAGYESGFIEHYIYPLLYPPGLTRSMQMWLAGIVLGANAAIYGWLLVRYWRNRREP
ncbi:MAG: DUF2784 domain-containing protein [Woeseiaceae bacterium]